MRFYLRKFVYFDMRIRTIALGPTKLKRGEDNMINPILITFLCCSRLVSCIHAIFCW